MAIPAFLIEMSAGSPWGWALFAAALSRA